MAEQSQIALEALISGIARSTRDASFSMATLTTAHKNAVLRRIAALCDTRREALQQANAVDLENGRAAGLSAALLDRLTLHDKRIDQMAQGVLQVERLPDPVGEFIEQMDTPSGLDVRKVRVPIGVVGIIYESRPNVTIDCAALCIKSGNACILRGGKEAIETNRALAAILSEALEAEKVHPAAVSLIPTVDRDALTYLLKLDDLVHCIIPRGGEGLIRFVAANARMPVIKHYTGVCSTYVDAAADPAMAVSVVVNAKCQRPGVCNAIENLFIHESLLQTLLPDIARALIAEGVELRAEPRVVEVLKDQRIPAKEATEDDFFEEYLDLILAIKSVKDVDEAIQSINRYGSGHSDAIITTDGEVAEKFLNAVDAATVYWNASTRYTDGFEFGLGAEIGISTDRLHARGPMGLRELCSYKYKIYGKGELR